MIRRYRELQVTADASNKVRRMVVTTDAPVMINTPRGVYAEILSHAPGAVDTSSISAVLYGHDDKMVSAAVRKCESNGTEMWVDYEMIPGAMLPNNVSVEDAIASGAVRGVSGGFEYNLRDCKIDHEKREIRVGKWRLLEASFTPIPADTRSGLRSADHPLLKDIPMPDAEPTVAELQANLARANTEIKIRALASEHKLDLTGHDFAKPEAEQLTALLVRKAAEKPTIPAGPVTLTVVKDEADKFIAAAQRGLCGEKEGVHLSAADLMRRCAIYDGERAAEWTESDLASYSTRRASYSKRDAANKTSASFSVLLGSTANKRLLNGFNLFVPTWSRWCTVADAANFNTHPNVSAAGGRLTLTAENLAFPELSEGEGSYNSQLGMWGATVSITEQALINDELGQLMKNFQRAGYAAARTIERQVFNVLLNATWTNDTSTGSALGTAGNLDKVRAGLKGKLGPAGEKMELEPKFLIVDPANRYNADLATGQIYKVDSLVAQGSSRVTGLEVVDSTFVGDTSLLAGALTTTYFLAGDPNVVDTVLVEFLRGMRVPEIKEFDPGATAAAKYKIQLPFQATIATHTDSAAAARVTGIQKATVA
jgi:hypothetical protein